MDKSLVAGPAATVRPSTALTAIVVSADGVRQMVATADLRELVTVGKFFWIDIIGSNEAACATLLRELGLEDADITWARRFGQLGCMVIDRQRLRTVTWLAEHHDVTDGNPSSVHRQVHTDCLERRWQDARRNQGAFRRMCGRTPKEPLSSRWHRSAVATWHAAPGNQRIGRTASGPARSALSEPQFTEFCNAD